MHLVLGLVDLFDLLFELRDVECLSGLLAAWLKAKVCFLGLGDQKCSHT